MESIEKTKGKLNNGAVSLNIRCSFLTSYVIIIYSYYHA